MKNKQIRFLFLCIVLYLLLAGCGSARTNADTDQSTVVSPSATEEGNVNEPEFTGLVIDYQESNDINSTETEKEAEAEKLTITIGDVPVAVEWEDNESVEALKELVKGQPLTIQMSMYGGFEQVGPLESSLPRNDMQTTTQSGDIVLYSGNQIVVFYGSNSWAYTRLGRVTDKSSSEMTNLLSNGDVIIIISYGG